MFDRLNGVWPIALVFAGVLACAIGLITHSMGAAIPWPRLANALVLCGMSIAAAALLRRWRDWQWANALALVWFVALVVFCGVLPVAATLLIAAAATALGACLIPSTTSARAVLALPVGLALIAGVDGWLLPLPIHRVYVYLPLLLALCIWRRRDLRALLGDAWERTQDAVDKAANAAAFAVLVLGLASTGAWLPTMQADDLAYHLALPSELLRHGFYSPDPSHQIWALAPWLGDVLHGIAQVLAGREARGAVDMLWIVSAAAATWHLGAALRGNARTCWLAVAAFASLPLLAALAAGMQTELPATALLIALALAIVRGRDGALVPAAGVLVGGLAGLKLGHALATVVLCLWAMAHAGGHLRWRRVALACGLFVLVAGSSYVFAAWLTGNPVLPLFNDVFQAGVMPARQLDDPRWHEGFGLALPWSITFDTDRYLEGWDGGFGYALILLAGAWLLALLRTSTRGIAVAATAITLLPLVPMQYARYAFPGMALLLPILLVVAREAVGERRFTAIAVALCGLNLAFQANASGILHNAARRTLVMHAGDRDEVLRRYAPERALIAELRTLDDGDSIVLALDPLAPFVAELGSRGRSVAWYDPGLEQARIAADTDASGERWQRLIDDAHARWLLLRPERSSAALDNALSRAGAELVSTVGEAQLWSIRTDRAKQR